MQSIIVNIMSCWSAVSVKWTDDCQYQRSPVKLACLAFVIFRIIYFSVSIYTVLSVLGYNFVFVYSDISMSAVFISRIHENLFFCTFSFPLPLTALFKMHLSVCSISTKMKLLVPASNNARKITKQLMFSTEIICHRIIVVISSRWTFCKCHTKHKLNKKHNINYWPE